MFATLTRKLWDKLARKAYRDEYVAEGVRSGIAYQVRALREQPDRGWSQKMLAKKLGKPQSVVSRIENPDYGRLNIQTLLELAAVFDVGLIVRFVSFPQFFRVTENVSPEALTVESFDPDQFLVVDNGKEVEPDEKAWEERLKKVVKVKGTPDKPGS